MHFMNHLYSQLLICAKRLNHVRSLRSASMDGTATHVFVRVASYRRLTATRRCASMSTNAPLRLRHVMSMQSASIPQAATSAHVQKVTREMAPFALVRC